MVSATALDRDAAWAVAAGVPDPELPMVTIGDLGILRDVAVDGARITVTITPTYSGCPAMREIAQDVRHRLLRAGCDDVVVRHQLTPAWTTDWLTANGRKALAENGIAPPAPALAPAADGRVRLTLAPTRSHLACPNCGSVDTVQTSAFSGTACKALYRCEACREPFEYLKAI